jgi:excisionase family DNA binding protein
MADLVDVDSIARAVNLNKFTIYRLAQQHKVPCYRAGRALRFDVEEVRDWMRGQAKKGAAIEGKS